MAAWLCILLAMLGAALGFLGAVLGAVRKRAAAQVLGGLAIAFGILAVGTGLVGRVWGEGKVESILVSDSISPDMKERIRAEGKKEAGECVVVGAASGSLPFLLGVLAMGLGFALQKRPAS